MNLTQLGCAYDVTMTLFLRSLKDVSNFAVEHHNIAIELHKLPKYICRRNHAEMKNGNVRS